MVLANSFDRFEWHPVRTVVSAALAGQPRQLINRLAPQRWVRLFIRSPMVVSLGFLTTVQFDPISSVLTPQAQSVLPEVQSGAPQQELSVHSEGGQRSPENHR